MSNGKLISRMSFRVFFILLLPCFLLLQSCSSHHVGRGDGPPNFYIDETKIPNAVPKPEKPARFGNMSSYRVFGKRYYTLKSSKNYDATGVASWYGTKFHAQRTSSGERYNMLAMTAAHKSLPLPTYVEVTNLHNHRKVIVKVNDRGPFMSNRLIDLSYVAAKKLGMANRGTALVRVRAINRYGLKMQFADAEKAIERKKFLISEKMHRPHALRFTISGKQAFAASSKKFHSNSRPSVPVAHKQNISSTQDKRFVYLQVGSFTKKSHAVKMQKRLASQFKTPVKVSSPSRNGSLYRVQIGPFKDIAKADEVTHRLNALGIKPNKNYGA